MVRSGGTLPWSRWFSSCQHIRNHTLVVLDSLRLGMLPTRQETIDRSALSGPEPRPSLIRALVRPSRSMAPPHLDRHIKV
jgi:hypothetical protein